MTDQPGRACPKHMTYGPCGGVGPDGACEIGPEPCVFLHDPVVPWPGMPPADAEPGPAGRAFRDLMRRRPVVISGMPAAPLDACSIADTAEVLRGSVDAVLTGDMPAARVQFPPAYHAMLVQERGIPVWAGLNCRDRNRVALEGEVAALAHAGVAGVHCVTGDHTFTGHRPDAAAVFDLESHELVPRARAAGLLVSVAESPAAPPVERRGGRLAQKVRAGAQLCLLQFCGEAQDVAAFIGTARAAGADVPVLPAVPVIVDEYGARVMASFAAAVLPAGLADSVRRADDPAAAGIEAAVCHARELLTVDGVAGVVLNGVAAGGAETLLARSMAAVGRALGAGR
ncbi:methylenetetrahydrofolate reductase C-terminal domain-containing protein [Pseudonocardia sp. CA-142604]|uniref:methylenetetrahydrofolate reductase n=1 Tax=Pseudonocardia sp. CA-142604 TaxID=3240024 RepID=UPI003D93F79C